MSILRVKPMLWRKLQARGPSRRFLRRLLVLRAPSFRTLLGNAGCSRLFRKTETKSITFVGFRGFFGFPRLQRSNRDFDGVLLFRSGERPG
jgi:hypothetical protein